MVQVILWVILGGALGVAALVVRHKRFVGSVDLADVRTVDLPDGVVAGVRLPRGWAVERDPAEHEGGDPGGTGARDFEAREPAGGVGGTPEGDGPEYDRVVFVRFQPLTAAVSAKEEMDRSGVLAHTVDRPGDDSGPMPVAGTEGWWASFGRPTGVPPGQGPVYRSAYAAAGVVQAGPDAPTPVAVLVKLECPPGDQDARGDLDLLRRVSAAITVTRDRPPAVPSVHPPVEGR